MENIKSIGDLTKIYKGRKAENVFGDKRPDSVRYLQIEDLRPDSKKKYTSKNGGFIATEKDILIAWDGANAGTVNFGLNGFIGSTLAALRFKNKDFHTPFIGRFLQSKFEYLRENCTGATIPHINREALQSLSLRIPKPDEQKRIAAILDKADRLRRQRRFAQTLSDSFLQSVFIEMFGDPANNPKGWTKFRVEEVLSKNRKGIRTGPFGSSLKRHEYVESGIPVWGINNVNPNEFIEDNPLFITREKYGELQNYKVSSGDILISRAGTVGRMCIANPKTKDSIIGTNLVLVVLDFNKIIPNFFTALFTYFPYRVGNLRTSGDENAYSFLNPSNLREILIPIPPLPLQEKFAEIVQKFERVRRQQREATRQAEHLFQTLLHRAFRGEL